MRRPRLIPGRSILGFWGWFSHDFGDPSTESPMRVVTPSNMGGALLPWSCPRCGEVSADMTCPIKRERYKDPRPDRDNYFCPSCGCRYRLDTRGVALPCTLPAGATVAPSQVTWRGETTWNDMPKGLVATVLGIFGGTSTSGYLTLARTG